MGRWDDFDDDWNYYRPGQPIKIEGGLKARSKQGAIGETWWSRRWINVLESFSMGSRLTRGRGYARQGQVASIDVEPGIVKARVQGSQPRPYNVKIQLKPLADRDWERVIDAMAAQALFAAKLLAGEMPTTIEEAFSEVKLSLFPTTVKDLVTSCSCPDWANPCKHIAAVYYLLAERFDEDPFLIFKLRGRTKDEIIQALRARRTAALPPASGASATSADLEPYETGIPLEECLETFWQAGAGLDSFAIHPGASSVDKAVLKRLGDAPYSIDRQNLTVFLARAYDAIDAALRES
ncbi:MAG TPA: SWIM zinc finger family protein [Ktedonobacteraceae bacterium]